jgi:sugar phosphate isomerase/epimerase
VSTPTFTLTGFADEIADDLDTQLDVLTDLGVEYLDLRSVWGTNVLDLGPDAVDTVERRLDERGIGVSAIGSPIGKVGIGDDFDAHLDRFETALDRAERFGADYIRLFSYWMPEGDDPAVHRDEVVRRMRAKAERAADRGVVLLHENEKDIYGDTPERCRDIVTAVDSPHLRLIFDPANYLEIGVTPYPDALLQVVEFVEFLHVKDAVRGERGAIRPAGEGDGRITDTARAFADRGFSGFASLEPHLAEADEMGGYSGAEAFRTAHAAFCDCLDAADVHHD